MSFKQKRPLMNIFIESQFGCCPLVWMFHSRKVNSKINHLQEQFLRIIYNDYITSLKDLLKKDNSFRIHHKNIQSLAIELFKVEKGTDNPILCNIIFPLRSTDYNLRPQAAFSVSSVNTTHFGLNSFQYFASKVWNMVLLLNLKLKNGNQGNAKVHYVRCMCTV